MDTEARELLLCDGEHDIAESEKLHSLCERGIIAPCERGEQPSEWSRFRKYPHRFVPAMNLMLTGKCNYNCRHCFNAADNADRMAEWDYGALVELFDQAAECGIHSFTLTGGEPMLYPRFNDIVRAIPANGSDTAAAAAARSAFSTPGRGRVNMTTAPPTLSPAFSSRAAGTTGCVSVWDKSTMRQTAPQAFSVCGAVLILSKKLRKSG